MTRPLIVKLGGELIESAEGRNRIAPALAGLAAMRPLVVVHGGGRAVDAACDRQGIAPRKVDGLRITDGATLDVVANDDPSPCVHATQTTGTASNTCEPRMMLR